MYLLRQLSPHSRSFVNALTALKSRPQIEGDGTEGMQFMLRMIALVGIAVSVPLNSAAKTDQAIPNYDRPLPPPLCDDCQLYAGPSRPWVSDDDYPPAALRRHVEGAVTARLTIELRGHVENCVVIRSSGDRELDETTCRLLLRRARFKPPATKAQHFYVFTHHWRLPPD